jgi:hypothetical protein
MWIAAKQPCCTLVPMWILPAVLVQGSLFQVLVLVQMAKDELLVQKTYLLLIEGQTHTVHAVALT